MTNATPAVLPVVGAAMQVQHLPAHREWLIADQRDLEIQDPAWPDFPDRDATALKAEIKAQLDGYTGRMGVHGPFLGFDLAGFDRLVREATQTRLLKTLDFCAEIGATHMVMHSPVNFLGTPYLPFTPDMGQGAELMVVQNTLAPVIAHAEQLKVTLVIENIFDKLPALWVALSRNMNSEYVRCSLDVGHAFINHLLGAPTPDYWAAEAGTLLGHVHLQDTDGFADRHWAPGEGRISFMALFNALAKVENQPRLILELADYSKIISSAAYFAAQGWAR